MIKFFRKIRQNLLSEGKTGKYLKYAIGEVILVMIGILLALQANNWNIERNNTLEEIQILKQLEKDYIQNLSEIEQKISLRNKVISSVIRLNEIKANGLDGISLDSLRYYRTFTYYNITYDGTDGITNLLLNSGKLNLIKNDELKYGLSNWKSKSQKLIEEEQLLVTTLLPSYWEYTINNFNYSKMGGIEETPNNTIYIGNERLRDVTLRYNTIKTTSDLEEWSKWFNDQTVFNHLEALIGRSIVANNQALGFKDEIKDILDLIRSELVSKK